MPGFGFLAGVLSVLSPCVLPLLPLLLGAAASQHRLGPVALAGGLALSFTAIGLFVATVGFAIGLDADVFRAVSAFLLVALGIVLAVPAAQTRLAAAAGPVGDWTERRFGGFSTDGVGGQFALGLLLGAVWSPCVGPTLGAASLMAARGENLGMVALTMAAFGLGAGLPLAAMGYLSRDRLVRMRGRMLSAGKGAKTLLGLALAAAGVAILTGADKALEARLVEIGPDWLTRLTTSI
ncbi:cytochrome c biogenesis CcdA family protein [Oharaeibacter diazotrophicus]|uniref:Cytochrome c biogenesis protein CcdA n=1 Tax=Oharaeibacter diazotrophicus TaxID=1920512 RepID=A0A4R6RKL9_9HYPH|nr:cytochrome c biogenesis protein CcdA [Oharaeibacter diazotrophicus]TDP87159.1 cytochrome c biogenesis protein CcdA [Oharaeibacter diazotrophicus]BBE70898.1 Methylamine oxidation protein MauF [Pleomorphomonas sp. SM30]GLS77647.1 cytochrome C biogenesis protein CcdA [Oharaeibacter diazotrophicus]